jgi:hypothetical protein
VDAPLGLGGGHALDAVHAAFPLQARPHTEAAVRHALRLDRHGDVLDATEFGLLLVQYLRDPAVPFGVAQVHAQQVAGEQRRLLAPLARLDLEDHVLAVVGVAGRQEFGEALLDDRDALTDLLGLFGEGGVLGREFARRDQVRAGLREFGRGLVDRRQFGEAPADPAGGHLVGMDRGVGEALLQLRVLVEQFAEPVGAHSWPPLGCPSDPYTMTAPARPCGRGAP